MFTIISPNKLFYVKYKVLWSQFGHSEYLILRNSSPLFIGSNKFLNFVLAIPVNIMISAEIGVHNLIFLIFKQYLVKSPNQTAAVIRNRVDAWLICEIFPIADIQNKCYVVSTWVRIYGTEGLVSVSTQYFVIL